ncbi:MAG TPA: hypothetical protein ENI98_13260 [Gammaproteobacteria bacterium]|nr:hypothetical protein [Gammaproteobacteria bacterium]
MRKEIKAALLSAFVFPGAGHFFLKKYLMGTILATATFASLYFLVSETVKQALEITDKIQNGGIQLDVTAITELVSRQMNSEAQVINIASIILIVFWLIGILDSYRIGRTQSNDNTTGN